MLRIILVLCLTVYTYGQKEATIWYFGHGAGLDFSTTPPTVLEDNNKMAAREGCGTISDASGNLLFYSDGRSVWNKNHVLMQDTSGGDVDYLNGGVEYATQTGLIIPKPNTTGVYYLLSVPHVGADNIYYSTIDFRSNPAGVVTATNVPLYTGGINSTEKVTCVLQENGTDFWLVSHEYNNDKFVIHKITNSGILFHKKISTGIIHRNNGAGWMKFSLDGKKLVVATFLQNRLEIFDFDIKTGNLTLDESFYVDKPFGVAFSPNSKLLYITNGNSEGGGALRQYNLTASSISASGTVIRSLVTSSKDFPSCLQIGTDGKIYVNRAHSRYMGVIQNPNVLGSRCDYDHNHIDLNPSNQSFATLTSYASRRKGYERYLSLLGRDRYRDKWPSATGEPKHHTHLGLPNFVANFLKSDIKVSKKCFGDETSVEANIIGGYVRYELDFGDGTPLKTGNIVSGNIKEKHRYSSANNYTITIKLFKSSGSSTDKKISFEIYSNPVINFSSRDVCISTANINLNASPTGGNYTGTGVSGNTFSPSTAGIGNHRVTYQYQDANKCTSSKTVMISVEPLPNAGTGGTLNLCADAVPTLTQLRNAITGEDTGGTWSPSPTAGATTYTYSVSGSGACSHHSSSSVVTINYQAKPNAGTDGTLALCTGQIPTLTQLQNTITREDTGGTWSPSPAAGITTYTYTVSATAPCTGNDTSTVTINYQNTPNAGTDGTLNICTGTVPTLTQLQNTITGEDTGGTWSPSPTAGVTTYTYTVNATAPCTGNDTSTVTINYRNTPNAGTDGTISLCTGQIPTLAQLQDAIIGEDMGGTWIPSPTAGVTSYMYLISASPPCTASAISTVTVNYVAKPNAGTDGTIGLCAGTVPTLVQLQDAITGEDVGGTWSPSPAIGVTSYTYTVTNPICSATATSKVTVRYQATPKAGTDGTIGLCTGTVPTLNQLQNAITGEDTGGTWSPSPTAGVTTYTYTVNATAPCTGNDTSTVTINYRNTPNAGTDGTLNVCTGTAPTLTQLQNAITGEDMGGAWSPSPAVGITTYTYTVNATAPCTGNDTSTVTINYRNTPNAGTDGTISLCSGTAPTIAQLQDAITGEDTGGNWSPLPAVGVTTYTYTIRHGSCPEQNSTVTIHYNLEITFDLQRTYILCPEKGSVEVAVKNPSATYNYRWYDDKNNLIGSNAKININKQGRYRVAVTDVAGICTRTENVDVIDAPSIPKITKKHLVFSNNDDQSQTLEIAFNNATDYYLFALNNTSNFVNRTVFKIPFGAHKLYIKDKTDCFKMYHIDIIAINPPKFFTPNDDTVSDLWIIKGLNLTNFKSFELTIMDRYGNLLKTYQNKFTGWDGTNLNGKKMRRDDYWYVLVVKNHEGSQMIKKGHFSLIND